MIEKIPSYFFNIPYDGKVIPGRAHAFPQGANCQVFTYKLLEHFGHPLLPPFRSSELWEDDIYTELATDFQPFDLILLHSQTDAFGAHVGVHVGAGNILHLARHHGFAKVESLEEMRALEKYRCLIGGKRLKTQA